jgi:hypothetical protein
MKKIRLLALLLCLTLLFTGCAAASAPKGEAMNNAVANPEAGNGIYNEGEKTENVTGIEENRKLIRTITMEAETSDLDQILADLDAQLAALGGFVQNKSVQNGRGGSARHATLTLRIPADKVDLFVDHVEGATNILSSNETAEDVTLKYAATESRIKALETKEARLLELMTQAKDLQDLLTLENQLATVRQELETVKSQLKLYDSLIDYGTIKLTVWEVREYTVVEEEEEPTAWQRIGNGFVNSVKGVWHIVTEIFIFLVVALPYLVIPGVILAIVLVVNRKRNTYRPPRNIRKPTASKVEPAPEQPTDE